MEQVGDGIVDGDETLKLSHRLEAFHDPFLSSDRLVRILRPIAQALWLRCSKAEVEPHCMRDDLGRKAVAAIERITGNLRHAA
jgi:hypothetical protein